MSPERPGFLPPPPWEGPPVPGATWRVGGTPRIPPGFGATREGPSLEALTEAKRAELEGRGYPPGLVQKALGWAWNYSEGMTRLIPDPAVQESLMRSLYPQALKLSETWISRFVEAARD